MKLSPAKLLLACVVALVGCRVQGQVYIGHPHHVRVVVIEPAHVHDEHCGHYWHEQRWHYWEGHHHHPGCGHLQVNGRWEVDVHARAH